jgi:hypothetical protein
MRVKIDFPEDIAQERAEEAKNWQPGTPLVWEAKEYKTEKKIEKKNGKILIKTPHIEVELDEDEINKIKEL